ncbi:MAG TPA: hemerythrin domain-containing protein [Acidobacteriaceae bacterium]
MSRLIQHIVRTHHRYVRCELPRLVEMAHKLTGKHGARAPELKEVETLLDALHAEMFAHLQKEEQVLFPFIAQMEEETAGFASSALACFQTVAQPVSMMVREHESAEGLVAEMRRLTNEFKTSAWACPTHVALYAGLNQFERDLRKHVHLENDILVPRAIEMEFASNQRR